MVADPVDLPERVPMEEEAADERCAGVPLLEYIGTIACEDLSESGEVTPLGAPVRPRSTRWQSGSRCGEPASHQAGTIRRRLTAADVCAAERLGGADHAVGSLFHGCRSSR